MGGRKAWAGESQQVKEHRVCVTRFPFSLSRYAPLSILQSRNLVRASAAGGGPGLRVWDVGGKVCALLREENSLS